MTNCALMDAYVDAQFHEAGLPKPERETKFHPKRKWRFDYSVFGLGTGRAVMVALEIQGGIWTRGKHGRGSGIVKDYEKLNAAQAMGWTVLQLTPDQVRKGELLRWLQEVLRGRSA